MKPIEMAIIGFGKSATRYHLPFLKGRNDIKIKYVYSSVLPQQRVSNDSFELVDDLDKVLNDRNISFITLCTPPETHYHLARKCILHGKHVIIEKPFCQTHTETKALLQLAKEQGVKAIPYQNRRFDSDYLILKDVLAKGYVGRPIELEAHCDYFRPVSEKRVGNQMHGSLYALGVHYIDQIVSLFGTPHQVSYDVKSVLNEASTLDDYYDIALHYGMFKAVVKSSQLVASSYPRFTLHGDKGSFIKYGCDQQENDLKLGIQPSSEGFGEDAVEQYGKVTYHNQNGDRISKTLPTLKGNYGHFYDEVYRVITEKQPSFISDETILTTIKIIENAFKQPNPSVITLTHEMRNENETITK